MSKDQEPGASLVEIAVTLAVLLVVATYAAPDLGRWRSRQRVLSAAAMLATEIQGARAAAIASGRSRGIVFGRGGELGTWRLAVDGDGDGIGLRDVRTGIDPTPGPVRRLAERHAGVSFVLPASIAPVQGGRRPSTPVPMSASGVLAISPAGTSSTGTIYLCHAERSCAAIRLYGPGGRVSLWEFDGSEWRRRW